MKTSFYMIFKIEMTKLLKRKDWLALLALAGINLLFGMAILSGSYQGPKNQSVLFWICTQILNASMLCFTPLIFSFMGARILSAEIENASILLYLDKFRNRKRMYAAKSASLLFFSVITFIFLFLINLATYYIVYFGNKSFFSNQFLGENTAGIFITMAILYVSSFLLTSQLSLCLGTFLKPTPVIGIMFLITMVCHNTYRLPVLRFINPWYYIVRIGGDICGTTQQISINWKQMTGSFGAFILLSIMYLILFYIVGSHNFKHKDLNP